MNSHPMDINKALFEELKYITRSYDANSEGDFKNWLSQNDVIDFLGKCDQNDEIILYSTLGKSLFYGFIASNEESQKIEIKDLVEYHCNPRDGWGITTDGWGKNLQLEPPVAVRTGSMIKLGMPLFFIRKFLENGKPLFYFELSEKIAHILDLHYVKNKNSYDRIDENGCSETIIKIVQLDQDTCIATIKTSDLKRMLDLLKSVYVFLFCSDRFLRSDDIANNSRELFSNPEKNLHYNFFKSEKYSAIRGFRILLIAEDQDLKHEPQYESFMVFDKKNRKYNTVSCDPKEFKSTQSREFPQFLTPVFFKSEVLNKYKNNPNKYTFINENRAVKCLNLWCIKFDINEENQVHVYLGDLQDMPYQEQSYWKSYNIESSAPISERSFNADFLCKFEDSQEPVQILKRNLKRLSEEKVGWFKLENSDLLSRINSVFSDENEKEWLDQIMLLDQLIIEGLNRKYFVSKAYTLQIEVEKNSGSLKLIEDILNKKNTDKPTVDMIIKPLKILHQLRSSNAHRANKKERDDVINRLLSESKDSFRIHFDCLLTDCIKSIELLASLAQNAVL